MTKQVNGLPAVNPDEPASEAQIKLLKEIGKYKEGMTKDEASTIISLYKEETSMPAGIHGLKIAAIEEATRYDGTAINDKDGNPALRITFRNKAKQTISDIFYYSDVEGRPCKSEFKIRKLKQALKIKPEESQDIEKLKTIVFWGLVQDVHHIDEAGNPVTDRDGKPIVSKQLLAEYYPGDFPSPAIAGDPKFNDGVPKDKFISTKVVKAKESSEAPKHDNTAAAPSKGGSEDDWA